MSAGSIIELQWPREMRRGDERYIPRAIVIPPHSTHDLRVAFLFDDAIRISGPYLSEDNVLVLAATSQKVEVGLKFIVKSHAEVGSAADIAVSVTRIRWRYGRIVLGCALLVLAITPEAMALHHHLFSKDSNGPIVQLATDAGVIWAIPVVLLLGVAVLWGHLVHLAAAFLKREENTEQILLDVPELSGAIEILDNPNRSLVGKWTQEP